MKNWLLIILLIPIAALNAGGKGKRRGNKSKTKNHRGKNKKHNLSRKEYLRYLKVKAERSKKQHTKKIERNRLANLNKKSAKQTAIYPNATQQQVPVISTNNEIKGSSSNLKPRLVYKKDLLLQIKTDCEADLNKNICINIPDSISPDKKIRRRHLRLENNFSCSIISINNDQRTLNSSWRNAGRPNSAPPTKGNLKTNNNWRNSQRLEPSKYWRENPKLTSSKWTSTFRTRSNSTPPKNVPHTYKCSSTNNWRNRSLKIISPTSPLTKFTSLHKDDNNWSNSSNLVRTRSTSMTYNKIYKPSDEKYDFNN